ncbi:MULTISPECIES: hypothetical protein [Nocardia]|uniref:Uncharacterized protein n=1 Tax=Nocardia aurantia TaxID=2585199 RepID=A0A7K0DR05_9NOCA|nr:MULTISPECIES: hypothetical protein [Nocardia]MQY28210.1 hypothetical protein [Nocardia aurantia]
MGTNLATLLYNVLIAFRWIGLIILTIASMAILISESAKAKLSPGKVLAVAGSAIVAAVVFWVLPSLVNYARVDATTLVPGQPIGGYR